MDSKAASTAVQVKMPLETLQGRLQDLTPLDAKTVGATCPLCGRPEQLRTKRHNVLSDRTFVWLTCSCDPAEVYRTLNVEANIIRSGLAESCRQFAGKRVYVNPAYGWGWSRLDIDSPGSALQTFGQERACPVPFYLHIYFFYEFLSNVHGAIGIIEEPGHMLDGLWAEFYPRVEGIWDFTEHLTYYNIDIGPNAPVLVEPEASSAWPRWEFSGSPRWAGYCNGIGADRKIVERYEARWKSES